MQTPIITIILFLKKCYVLFTLYIRDCFMEFHISFVKNYNLEKFSTDPLLI